MKFKALKKSKNKSKNKNLRRVSLFELQNSPKALLLEQELNNFPPKLLSGLMHIRPLFLEP